MWCAVMLVSAHVLFVPVCLPVSEGLVASLGPTRSWSLVFLWCAAVCCAVQWCAVLCRRIVRALLLGRADLCRFFPCLMFFNCVIFNCVFFRASCFSTACFSTACFGTRFCLGCFVLRKVLVVGREGMNRSIHGDTVAVTLLPKTRYAREACTSIP